MLKIKLRGLLDRPMTWDELDDNFLALMNEIEALKKRIAALEKSK